MRKFEVKFHPIIIIGFKLGVMLLLYTFCRLAFYFYNSPLLSTYNTTEFLFILFKGLQTDIVAILYINLPFIYFSILWQIRPKFIDIVSFVLINTLGLIINIIDIPYFTFVLKRASIHTLGELSLLNNGAALSFSFLKNYGLIVFPIMGIGLMLWYLNQRKIQVKNLSIHGKIDTLIFSSFFILAGLRGGSLAHAMRPIGLNFGSDAVKQPHEHALVINSVFSILKTIGTTLPEDTKYFDHPEEFFNPIISIKKSSFGDKFNNHNVVILVVESYSEESTPYTPFLDSLRKHSYTSEFGFANGKKSIEALPAIWSGIPSLLNQPFVLSPFGANKYNSLPRLLAAKGYQTAFFHGAPNGSMGFDALAKQAGIKKYFGLNEYGKREDSDDVWGIWDEPFLQFAVNKMSETKQPFMSTIFTLSSHDPFKVPFKYQKTFKIGSHPIYETLGYADMAIRKFFESAKKQDWYKNTLFIVTADHTASYVHHKNFKTAIGLHRIPIFFYHPTISLAKRSESIFQQTDIAPSVLSLLGLETKFLAFGKNLFDSTFTKFAIFKSENSFYYLQNEHVLKFSEGRSKAFFNFAKDPLLQNNLLVKTKVDDRIIKALLQQYNYRMLENKLIP